MPAAVLDAGHRLRDAREFARTVRTGKRAGSATVVCHLAPSEAPGVRVGFVVSKAIGNAVTRNRVKRQLRHLVRDHVGGLSGVLVVRALPPAARASAAELAADLDSCLMRVSA